MIPVVGTDTSLNRNRNWAHLNRFSYKKNVAPSSMHSSVLSTSAYLLSAFIRLFPLREPGVNYMASELTKKEIEVSVSQLTLLCHFNCYSSFFVCFFFFLLHHCSPQAFKRNEDAKRRLVESYELMLGFYGIRLINKEIGEVTRAENWKERFGNLER